MGVPGLWDLLRPAAARTSLSTLAKEGFIANRGGLRAFTIGIDASLWIFHAQLPQHGENPFLRTIFFKLTTLLQQPVLPVFVFDGPGKPGMKRGAAVAGKFGTHDRRSIEFKWLLEECGLEWWNAPGEAEAELAIMNRQGKIDAVLSDDVDALLFGARCVLRNNSPTLSGSKASTIKGDLRSYEVYRSSAICDSWGSKDNTALVTEEDCRMAMVFIALLAGGDYMPEGLEAFGPTIAFGLAHAGLASLLPRFLSSRDAFMSSLPALQTRIVDELRTNSSKHVGRRYPDRANKLADRAASDVFSLSALEAYLDPRTSGPDPSLGWPGFGETSRAGTGTGKGIARNGGRGDMEGLARACERFFEWGTRDLVVKRFVSESVGVFGSEVMGDARRRVIVRDAPPVVSASQGSQQVQGRLSSFFAAVGSSQPQTSVISARDNDQAVVVKIERTRPDPTNPTLTEFRLLYKTDALVARVHGAMRGTRVDPKLLTPEERLVLGMVPVEAEGEEGDADGQAASKDNGLARVWVADWLCREAYPEVVKEWEDAEAVKAAKTKKGGGRTKGRSGAASTSAASQARGRGTPKKALRADGEDAQRFEIYFGATQRVVPTLQLAGDKSRTRVHEDSSEEEVETVEHRSPSKRASSSLTPVPPSPSLPPPKLALRREGIRGTSDPKPRSQAKSKIVPKVAVASSSRRARKSPSPVRGKTSRKPATGIAMSGKTVAGRGTGTGGSASAAIDLCSSSESESEEEEVIEPPRARSPRRATTPTKAGRARSSPRATRRSASTLAAATAGTAGLGPATPVLGASSRANSLAPSDVGAKDSSASARVGLGKQASLAPRSSHAPNRTGASPVPVPSPGATTRKTTRQRTLGLAVVRPAAIAKASGSDPAPVPVPGSPLANASTAAKDQASKTASRAVKGRRSYVMVREDEDEEVMDCTRGGENLAGYGYNK